MGLVTEIKKKKGRNEAYEVFIDGEYFSDIDAELIYLNGIRRGAELDEEGIKSLQYEIDLKKAYNLSIKYLSFKSRTTKEVEKYLTEKEFAEGITHKVVEKLASYRFLNDEEYMKNYTADRMNFSYSSRRKVRYELKEKGISQELVDKNFDSLYSPEDEEQILIKYIGSLDKKYRRDPVKQKNYKISQRAVEKGFGYDIIKRCLKDNVEDNSSSDEFLKKLSGYVKNAYVKYKKKNLEDHAVRAKVIQALMLKGYDYDSINSCLETFLTENEINF
ncbi:MAG: hypothetical protein HGA49_09500 [Eubacteriaceae bacterium]|nr:hypothetical protein [Eubacteriaceae bacterium]